MKRIVLFASGSGSNAEKIMAYFQNNSIKNVTAVVTNNPNAKVIEKAKKFGVPHYVFTKTEIESTAFIDFIKQLQPDLIVLAGFLLKIPSGMVAAFPNKIVNIHPSLLPKYGGKGMYGHFVHEAVFANNEKESGITIHFVNEHYDEGEFIFQEKTNIEECNSPEQIASKVLQVEHRCFAKVIDKVL